MQAVIRSKFHHLQREMRPAAAKHKSQTKIIAVFTAGCSGAVALNHFLRVLSEWIGASMKALRNELSCTKIAPCVQYTLHIHKNTFG